MSNTNYNTILDCVTWSDKHNMFVVDLPEQLLNHIVDAFDNTNVHVDEFDLSHILKYSLFSHATFDAVTGDLSVVYHKAYDKYVRSSFYEFDTITGSYDQVKDNNIYKSYINDAKPNSIGISTADIEYVKKVYKVNIPELYRNNLLNLQLLNHQVYQIIDNKPTIVNSSNPVYNQSLFFFTSDTTYSYSNDRNILSTVFKQLKTDVEIVIGFLLFLFLDERYALDNTVYVKEGAIVPCADYDISILTFVEKNCQVML